MAKFDYELFYGEIEKELVFNAKKYTKEQALEIAEKELAPIIGELEIEPAYVYYGFGTNYAGENVQGYWLTHEPRGNTFDAWVVQEIEEG